MALTLSDFATWDVDAALNAPIASYSLADLSTLTQKQYIGASHGSIYLGLNNQSYIPTYPVQTAIIGSKGLIFDQTSTIASYGQYTYHDTAFAIGFPVQSYIDSGGKLYTWGPNNAGALFRTATTLTVPTKVNDEIWKKVVHGSTLATAVGNDYTIGLKTNGTIWVGGVNTYGHLGNGSTTTVTTFAQSGTDTNWSDIFTGSISAGARSYAIKSTGTLWSCGLNTNSMTAQTATTGNTVTWTQVGTGTDWLGCRVCIASASVSILKADGTIWTVGSNATGMTGLGSTTGITTSLTQMGTATNWADLEVAYTNVWAVDTNGKLYGWGSNSGLFGAASAQSSPLLLIDGYTGSSPDPRYQFKALTASGPAALWAKTFDNKLMFYGATTSAFVANHLGVASSGYFYNNVQPDFKMYRTNNPGMTILY